jgi:hypothetical protein
VQIKNALLASYAEVRGGTVQVVGAFPEWFALTQRPSNAILYVVIQAQLESEDEMEREFRFQISLKRPDRMVADPPAVIIQTKRGLSAPEARPYDPIYLFVCTPLPLTLADEGAHEIQISAEGQTDVRTLPFGVRVVEAPVPETRGPTGPTGAGSPIATA